MSGTSLRTCVWSVPSAELPDSLASRTDGNDVNASTDAQLAMPLSPSSKACRAGNPP